jgi:hypothetical protein
MIKPARFYRTDLHGAQWRTNAKFGVVIHVIACNVSGSHLKKPRLSSCMPEVFRAHGFSCYRTSLQGTFHCRSAGIWKCVINRWCTPWLSWLGYALSRVLFAMLLREFFIDNLSGRIVALGSTQDCNGNEYHVYFRGG